MSYGNYEVVIVGGGVTGTALLYTLTRFTNINRIALIEKNSGVAQVNSDPLNNSQTSHDGGTETNYSLEKALKVQHAARMLRRFVQRHNANGLFKKTHRMVLGVGREEVELLRSRFQQFKDFYPDLRLVERNELRYLEPAVMRGRDSNEPVIALVSNEGYAINYQVLSKQFFKEALESGKRVHTYFNTTVKDVRREDAGYVLTTSEGELRASVLVFAAGAYSLLFAQKLGYGLKYGILPIAGSFFSAGKILRGKVYRVQEEGLPFAAVHGDPDVLNQNDTRFGPTTKPLPLMERHRYETLPDFLKLPLASLRGLGVLFRLIANRQMSGYVFKNLLYDLPFGKWLFLKEARQIVPSLKASDLKLRRKAGGIRPQIVNLETGALEMGDMTIFEGNCIFNTTPSPGASVCLANAKRDAERVVDFLGNDYRFQKKAFEEELEKVHA